MTRSKPLIFFRTKDEYQKLYNALFAVVIFFFCVILFLALLLATQVWRGPEEPAYYARNVKGQLTPMLAITGGIHDAQTYRLVVDALNQSFSLTSDSYKTQLPAIQAYFMGDGYNAYLGILQGLGISLALQSGTAVIQSELVSPITLDKAESHMYGDTYVWVYTTEITHTIRTPQGSNSITKKYKVLLKQMPTSVKSFGAAIYSIKWV